MPGVKLVVQLYLTVTGLVLLVFRHCPWPVRVPKYKWVKDKNFTTKYDYRFERYMYKMCHEIELDSQELKKSYYYLYRTIALKYGWPYIKEIYDDYEFVPRQPEFKLPSYSPLNAQLNSLKSSHLKLSHSKYLWWVLDALIVVLTLGNFWANDVPASASTLEIVLTSILIVVFLQVFFVVPYLLVKLVFWATKKTFKAITH